MQNPVFNFDFHVLFCLPKFYFLAGPRKIAALLPSCPPWVSCWLVGWLCGWLDGWLAGWLAGWLTAWLDDWPGLAGWLLFFPKELPQLTQFARLSRGSARSRRCLEMAARGWPGTPWNRRLLEMAHSIQTLSIHIIFPSSRTKIFGLGQVIYIPYTYKTSLWLIRLCALFFFMRTGFKRHSCKASQTHPSIPALPPSITTALKQS